MADLEDYLLDPANQDEIRDGCCECGEKGHCCSDCPVYVVKEAQVVISGYDLQCPYCEAQFHKASIVSPMECPECGQEMEVTAPEHVVG